MARAPSIWAAFTRKKTQSGISRLAHRRLFPCDFSMPRVRTDDSPDLKFCWKARISSQSRRVHRIFRRRRRHRHRAACMAASTRTTIRSSIHRVKVDRSTLAAERCRQSILPAKRRNPHQKSVLLLLCPAYRTKVASRTNNTQVQVGK
jgi:hypothetical protein